MFCVRSSRFDRRRPRQNLHDSLTFSHTHEILTDYQLYNYPLSGTRISESDGVGLSDFNRKLTIANVRPEMTRDFRCTVR